MRTDGCRYVAMLKNIDKISEVKIVTEDIET